jgi:hypothetical protein
LLLLLERLTERDFDFESVAGSSISTLRMFGGEACLGFAILLIADFFAATSVLAFS